MHLDKLTTLIQAIEKPLLKRLEAAIESPYFKLRPSAIQLFHYLAGLTPPITENKLNPERIQRLRPELGDKDNQKKRGAELRHAIELFFAFEQLQKKPLAVKNLYLFGLEENGIKESFLAEYQQAERMLEADEEKSIDHFYQHHLLIETAFNGFYALLKRNTSNDLNPVLDSLDTFYAVKKLRYLVETYNRNKIVGTPFHAEKLDGLFQLLEPISSPAFPYVYLFIHIFKMDSSPSFAEGKPHYDLVKAYLFNHANPGQSDTVFECLGYMLNWCLEWNGKGNQEAASEFLVWIDWKEKHNLLLQGEKIVPGTFRNIVGIAAFSKKEPQWIEQFIQKYASRMPEEHREINLNYVKGILHFVKKEYKKSIAFFTKAEAKSEPIFGGMIRRWTFMSRYEQNKEDKENLMIYLENFSKYLKRNEAEFHIYQKPYNDYILYCKKLLNSNKAERKHLLETLQQEAFFLGKYWIEEKLGGG